jgi:hypothetical protein
MAHMGRYTYSPTGALKWKKDVSEYAEALRAYGVPAVDEEMASLEQVGTGCLEWGLAREWGIVAEGFAATACIATSIQCLLISPNLQ